VDTGKYVVELLGLDWRGFLTSFLARQQELNALADLTPGRRRDHLAAMLGVDRLDRALKRIKDDGKLQADKIDFLQRQLAGRAGLVERLAELGEHAKALEKQVGELSGAWQAARDEFAALEKGYREHQEQQAACSRLEAQIEARHQTRKHLADQLNGLEGRKRDLGAKAETAASLEAGLVGLDELRERYRRLEQLRDRAENRRALAEQIQNGSAELGRVDSELEQRRRELSEAEKALGLIPESVDTDLAKATADLDAARLLYGDRLADSKAGERALSKVAEQVASIAQIGPETVCDRCHRPFGDDLPSIRQHLEEELASLTVKAEALGESLEKLRIEGETLKKYRMELQDMVSRRRELKTTVESLRREIGSAETRRGSLDKNLSDLRDRLAKIGVEEFRPEELERLKVELARLEANRTRFEQIRGELKAEPEVTESIRQVAAKLSLLDDELTGLQKELEGLHFDADGFEKLKLAYADGQIRLERAREDHLRAGHDLDLTRREMKAKEEELARLEKAGEELEENRVERFHTEKLLSLFRDFRKFTISRIRPRLAELAGELITDMSGGRYSLVELDEDYNLQIMDDGKYYGLERFSGGEKDLASLCLRLAISLALTEAAGLDRSFVILDEVFGSQDSGRRELIFRALARLKDRFPQTILITHLDELKNNVEILIEVEPQAGGWSEVRVDGATV
jgi:exonuclease SbcC